MPNIIVTETTGSQQVIGPDNNLNFLVSGSHSGDIVTINATGLPTSVNIDVTESGQNVTVTGLSTPQIINVTVSEGGVGGGSPLTVRDEGINVGTGVAILDFVGAGVEASGNGGTVTIFITGSGGAGGGGSPLTIQDEGIGIASGVTSINFVGNNVTASASGTAVTVNISGASGVSTPSPQDTQLVYNPLEQLSRKIDSITTCYSYNTAGQLTLLYRPDYIKEFYYSGSFLTGIDVTDPTPAIVLQDGCPLVNSSGRPYFGNPYLMPDGNPYLKPDGTPYLQPA